MGLLDEEGLQALEPRVDAFLAAQAYSMLASMLRALRCKKVAVSVCCKGVQAIDILNRPDCLLMFHGVLFS